MTHMATAVAHPNIAFIKYWGQAEAALHLPANPSISMVLDCLQTRTTVHFCEELGEDEVVIDATRASAPARDRVIAHLDRVRALANSSLAARVRSESNFPTGAGLASSASAFAALTVAATAALGLELSPGQLSALARLGSGSACRSIPAGFVEWTAQPDGGSAARSIAPPDHWALCDCIALVSTLHKRISSISGHEAAPSSPLHTARVKEAVLRVPAGRRAIEERDLSSLGRIMERDAVMMHAVAMTSVPPIYYWTPETMRVVRAVIAWRAAGLPVYYTIDAGPNVHCLCEAAHRGEIERRLRSLPGVQQVLVACPGDGARLTDDHVP
jgi:diphosphomevalonate decarboxylase